ncbi:cytochrome-c peroxidase [Patiriisocius marinistellae]|uniref:Cytochrome-c peroxidase n=1 Tax=Patiriisocius marinistellae TaxID=2494560 RepID=A0A5J4FYE2_9FLAO|nr:cytochrome c peroxidase [Patiriisocius marinistellae]GEQ84691.1 cytochrome-c peroxidase [Patiriisocius marinistellae]
MFKKGILIILIFTFFSSCNDDEQESYIPTPLAFEAPVLFQQLLPNPSFPADNPQTVEGVSLGRKLFFDKNLSADNTLACAGCHAPNQGFSDQRQFSIGIDGIAGFRNSMPLVNLAFNTRNKFNWDGSASSLEEQILEPVINEIEMHNTWPNAVATLQAQSDYPLLFEQAFGTATISKELATKAIAQFIRTIVSGNSKFDKHLRGEASLTPSEANGFAIFLDEDRGDCFHCHGSDSNPIWSDNDFHNNGLDEEFTDRGLGLITGDPAHFGLFKSPSLRNLAYTAPYMHDGRFETLDDVINHYSEGLVFSETIDPLMKSIAQGGVQLTEADKADLKAFLLSLSDPSLANNPNYQNPN